MNTIETDVAIIGVGSAGMSAYKAARRHTERIVTIEHGPYGTTCARAGCMPSKLLIAAGLARHAALQAPLFGVHTGPVSVDGEAVMRRVREERDRFVQFSLDEVQAWPDAHKLRGSARFVAPGLLQVDGHTQIKARSVVIATGSTPQVPQPLRDALGDRLIVNDDVFDWHTLPCSVAVIGTGVIGLELAHALHDLGVRVRLLGRSGKVGPATDPDVAQACATLTCERIPTHLKVRDIEGERGADGVQLSYVVDGDDGPRPHTETFDCVLMAAGRTPNLKGLELAAAGIEVDDKGLPPFDPGTRQIPGQPVFIAGDVNQHHPVLHEANDDGYAAGHNAAHWPNVTAQRRRVPLSIVFSRPQIALVGQGHRTLQEADKAFAQGRLDFARQGRARIDGINAGVLKVYADPASGRLLGAEMTGPATEHLGHLLAWALQQKQTVEQMLACPFYHPTVEEGLRTALQHVRKQLD